MRKITCPAMKQWQLHGRNITSPAMNEFIEMQQPKRYCLLVKTSSLCNIAIRKSDTDNKICNNALFYTKLARPSNIIVRISMVYLDLFYVSLLMRKQHVKCGPGADPLNCSISIKMASQPCAGCGGIMIANKPTQCVHSQLIMEVL